MKLKNTQRKTCCNHINEIFLEELSTKIETTLNDLKNSKTANFNNNSKKIKCNECNQKNDLLTCLCLTLKNENSSTSINDDPTSNNNHTLTLDYYCKDHLNFCVAKHILSSNSLDQQDHNFWISLNLREYYCVQCECFTEYDFELKHERLHKLLHQLFYPTLTRSRSNSNGLLNYAQVCYANSCLQCLVNSHLFDFFQQIDLEYLLTSFANFKNCRKERRFLEELNIVFHKLRNNLKNKEPYNLKTFFKYLKQLQPMSLQESRQEDAHEFLLAFFNALEMCFRFKISPIHAMFNLFVKKSLQCSKCGYMEETLEKLNHLPLCFPPNVINKSIFSFFKGIDEINLLELLDAFFEPEKHDWFCPKCQKNIKALEIKQISNEVSLPTTIIVYLKRFKNDFSKIQNKCIFPENLNLSKYFQNEISSTNPFDLSFYLKSIIVHAGTHDNGHYVTYSRSNLYSDEFYLFDDEQVFPCGLDTVLEQEAYLLFYERYPKLSYDTFIPISQMRGNYSVNNRKYTDYLVSSTFMMKNMFPQCCLDVSPREELQCRHGIYDMNILKQKYVVAVSLGENEVLNEKEQGIPLEELGRCERCEKTS
eukprot:TRINITY_DN2011_c0_g1_i1.p1 TRINITY_DN2011_c0_g1~~TRINITY_DN2011_c0_g1_i1.p1  ORF type:complete len:592 (+),score=118.88 TRINITY_DN2011_c0_g1_i1:97-1872(+)